MARNLTTGLQRGLQRRLRPGLGGGDLFTTAALDLNFARYKNLDPRITFTRASSATFVDSSGVLRSAVTNLLLQSEAFGTTWTTTGTSVSANTITAPNGTLTADTITEDSSTGDHRINQASLSLSNGFCTYSVYLKASTRSAARIQFDGTVGGTPSSALVDINLSTGITSGLAVNGNITSGSAVVSVLPDGWYRVSLTASLSAAATGISTRIFLLQSAGGASSYTGNGTGSVFAWGAQLEQASTVGDYVPTTSVINSAPRFDHNPTTGESLGLLVEEARTNLIVGSELFTGGGWTGPGNLSIASTTATTAPDSSNNAIKFTENTVASQFHFINYITTKAASVIQYTFSLYLKAAGREVAFSIANGSTGATARFNLATGTITGPAAAYGVGFTAQGATITPAGNGWYRCTLTMTTDSTTGLAVQFSFYNTALATNVYTGDGISGAYAWGAQLEAGAFPTSYIPTTTATVTRAADVASITGANFSSFYNQTEGTLYIESTKTPIPVTTTTTFADLNDGTTNNRSRFWIWSGATSTLRFTPRASSADQADLTIGTPIQNIPFKAAGSLKANDFAAVLNGGTVSTDGSGTVPTVDRLTIGNSGSASEQLGGTIKRLTYWPQRLSNEVLQRITQP